MASRERAGRVARPLAAAASGPGGRRPAYLHVLELADRRVRDRLDRAVAGLGQLGRVIGRDAVGRKLGDVVVARALPLLLLLLLLLLPFVLLLVLLLGRLRWWQGTAGVGVTSVAVRPPEEVGERPNGGRFPAATSGRSRCGGAPVPSTPGWGRSGLPRALQRLSLPWSLSQMLFPPNLCSNFSAFGGGKIYATDASSLRNPSYKGSALCHRGPVESHLSSSVVARSSHRDGGDDRPAGVGHVLGG